MTVSDRVVRGSDDPAYVRRQYATEEGLRARKAIYGQVQRILARDLPVVSLWHDDNVLALRRGVRGFEVVPTAQLTSLARTYKE